MSAEGPASGTVIGGKFKVLRTLGVGGMGAVYEIEHVFTQHRRALKLLHPAVAAQPAIVQRFLREASAAGRIGNPHIVETFDAGTLDSGEPYLVMELLSGQELTQQIHEQRRLNVGYLAYLIRQACSGVQAAHDAGVVHRDLKPDNLFVSARDGRPFVKILDFGISKFDTVATGDHAMTREGSMLGTPYYMPPEQVRGAKDLDARADVYALGVILYEAASGRRPFVSDTLPHLALLIHEGKPTPLSELRPELPPAFCQVVEKAMASQREHRFASAKELSDALRPFEQATTPEAFAATLVLEPAVAAPPASATPSTESPMQESAAGRSAEPPPNAVPVAPDGRPASLEVAAMGRTVEHPARPSRALPVLLVGGLLAVVAGVSVVALRSEKSLASSSASAEPSASSATAPLVVPASSAPQPAAAPFAAPTPSASPDAGPAAKTTARAGASAVAPVPSAATKAKKTGLDETNPY